VVVAVAHAHRAPPLPVHPLPAVAAAPAGRDTGDQDAVALADVLDGVAGLDHRPDGLVAQGAPLGAGGHVTLEDVQVGAADGGGVDLDDRVAGVLQLGIRLGLPLLAVRSVVDERLHGSPPAVGCLPPS